MTIVLKHLARELNLNPYQMRQRLRVAFPKHKGQWKWDDNDPKLKKVREALSDASVGKSSARARSSEAAPASSSHRKGR